MPFRLATLKLFGQSLSGNKKIAPKHNASKQFLVPVAGIEPARGISPKDFEFYRLRGNEWTVIPYGGP